MGRGTAEAWQPSFERGAQGRHRPPTRTAIAPAQRRGAGRDWTQRTRVVAMPRAGRGAQAGSASRMAMYAFAALALALVFLQIGHLAEIAQNTKQIAQLTASIREKKGEAGNLNMRLSMQRNIKRVHDEAVYRLGMIQPEDGQIRVIPGIGPSAGAQQQTVLNSLNAPVE